MIELENVTKIYPGQEEPAVRELSFEVPEGEICILVGPSGCGKTTSLKMINRIIEPTSGVIRVGGKNVMEQNPNQLRRSIGYVIQQIGLFPHQTIAENVATVPNLLGWDRKRTDERVDELLDLVGMDPDVYRHRYPRELSGGQRQRIGVARALAADPPVMLMDEPFGAVDPITRDRLQNEFLRLQEELSKTIAFVTHDIDEAIKMGDRIAILNVSGRLEQFDTPERILEEPANEFVADFVGGDRAMKRLSLFRVGDLDLEDPVLCRPGEPARELIERLRAARTGSACCVAEDGRPIGWVPLAEAEAHPDRPVEEIARSRPVQVTPGEHSTLKDVLSQMLSAASPGLVLDGDDEIVGVLTVEGVQGAMGQLRSGS